MDAMNQLVTASRTEKHIPPATTTIMKRLGNQEVAVTDYHKYLQLTLRKR